LGQIEDLESAIKAGQEFGYPLMIKSRRLAYDGRGNAVAKTEEALTSAINGIFINFFCCQNINARLCRTPLFINGFL
jgi:phosphoribosylaminoimidazole carboxylase (NCAIR synthetase)